jgi:hypothetical protein
MASFARVSRVVTSFSRGNTFAVMSRPFAKLVFSWSDRLFAEASSLRSLLVSFAAVLMRISLATQGRILNDYSKIAIPLIIQPSGLLQPSVGFLRSLTIQNVKRIFNNQDATSISFVAVASPLPTKKALHRLIFSTRASDAGSLRRDTGFRHRSTKPVRPSVRR